MADFRLINGTANNSSNSIKLVLHNNIAEALTPVINEQRKIFFDKRISEIKDDFFLNESEIQEIWNLFLAGEHPEYINGRVLELLPEIKNCPDEPINSDVSWCFHNFKWTWSLIWKDYQLKNAIEISARVTLGKEKTNKEQANHPSAKDTLKKELEKALPFVLKNISIPKYIYEIEGLISAYENEPFKLDLEAVQAIKNLDKSYNGEFAKEIVDFLAIVHQNSRQSERAESWKKPLFFHLIVARIVWRDCVKKKISSLINNPTAVTRAVYSEIIVPMQSIKRFDAGERMFLDYNDKETVRLSNQLSVIDEKILKVILPMGASLMSGLTAIKLVTWQLQVINQQFRDGTPKPDKLIIDGGYRGLREILHLNSNKATEELRAIIAVQAGADFKWPCGAHGNILLYKSIEAAPGRRAVLELTMAEIFCPHYTRRLEHLNPTRGGKKLIPIVDICGLVDPRRYHGAQARFQQEIIVAMRDRAIEFAMYGGVRFNNNDFSVLARQSQLPASLIPKVIDRMLNDGNDAPAFLDMIEKDTYSLAESFSNAQKFLINGAKKEISGSKGGSYREKKAIIRKKVSKKLV